jgi:MoaA/NifB/PqqE/SkfB family radical SAM enzyme
MSLEEFREILEHAIKLGISIISITGGEPLMWKPIFEAISMCSRHNISTQLTSNGHLLSKETVDRLSSSGLDMLSVSLDAVDHLSYSDKTISKHPEIIDILSYAKGKGMVVSSNTVLTVDNGEQVLKLAEILHNRSVPQSIGLIVEPPGSKEGFWKAEDNLIRENDQCKVQSIIDRIIEKKNSGYLILDPLEYFENWHAFSQNKTSWDCNLAKKHTVQIAPDGSIYWCSKLKELSPYKFTNMSLNDYLEFKKRLKTIIGNCNERCYSNCAYYSYYYQSHKYEFLSDVVINKYVRRFNGKKERELAARG